MKKLAAALCIFILLLTGCGGETSTGTNVTIKSGTYVYQRTDDILDKFTITLYDDGTFSYYETPISSFIGMGNYEQDENRITISCNIPTTVGPKTRKNIFIVEDDRLIWVEEGSDNFSLVTLSDGICFNLVEDEE